MQIKKIILSVMGTNVYLLETEKGIIVIDPADNADAIRQEAAKVNKPIGYALITHGHFDHCNAAADLQKDGTKIMMSACDFDMIKNGLDLAKYCGTHFNFFTPDKFLTEGEIILYDTKIQVLETPGHSAGSLTFIIENNIFCGDLMFNLSIGRTDLPTGDKNKLFSSIKKLYAREEGNVYSGHGEQTTLEKERELNPYVKA